jgi:hypothetical protein
MRAGNNDEIVVDCCDLDTLTELCCAGSVSEYSGRKGSFFGGRVLMVPRQTGVLLGGWPNQLQTQVAVLPLMDRSRAEGEVQWEGGFRLVRSPAKRNERPGCSHWGVMN